MALVIDLATPLVQTLVQIPLLGLGNVATILGLIPVQTVLLTSKLGVIVGCLFGIDLSVRNTPINATFLIVDTLLNFVDTRMTGIWYACSALGEGGTARPDKHGQRKTGWRKFRLVHDISLSKVGYPTKTCRSTDG